MSNIQNHKEVSIRVVVLDHGADLDLPAYATEESAGMDLRAALDSPLSIEQGRWQAIPTGLTIALPPGTEAQVRPRSGLAARQGLTVLNAPGTIDSDYRGEIKVLLINHGPEPVIIKRGDRIAQMIIAPVLRGIWQPTEELPQSHRGQGGFGHTGKA
ncbi:MAG: dUTP diphosphatase [Deltaproteobacteria bacterium]|nr:dUTP diphosphatase [Deltaproteobacteria bacterium]